MSALVSTLFAPVRRIFGYIRNDDDMDAMYGDRRTRRNQRTGNDDGSADPNVAGNSAGNIIGGWNM